MDEQEWQQMKIEYYVEFGERSSHTGSLRGIEKFEGEIPAPAPVPATSWAEEVVEVVTAEQCPEEVTLSYQFWWAWFLLP